MRGMDSAKRDLKNLSTKEEARTMKRTSKHIVFLLTCLALAANGYAQSPREQLSQLVEQLQKSPSDTTLRERIVKLGAELKPAPAIPEEARRSFVEGVTIVKSAKDASSQKLALGSFNEALKIAPWWGDAYYNLAVAQELTGQLDEAERTLKWFLLSNPGESDARDVQDRIYAIAAKRKLAAAESVAKQEKADREKSVYDWLLGEWRLNDEMKEVGGGAYSPTPAVSVQSVKEGDRIIFRRSGGGDFLRATLGEQVITWDHWMDIPYQLPNRPIRCPEDGAWNRVEVTISSDKKHMNFSFYQSHTGTCGHQGIHYYKLSR
jgi:tetratricopeptide (TPR) repeat protein